jgi:hypothetical protein
MASQLYELLRFPTLSRGLHNGHRSAYHSEVVPDIATQTIAACSTDSAKSASLCIRFHFSPLFASWYGINHNCGQDFFIFGSDFDNFLQRDIRFVLLRSPRRDQLGARDGGFDFVGPANRS